MVPNLQKFTLIFFIHGRYLAKFQAVVGNGIYFVLLNPLASPGEGATVFTYPYLSAGAPAQGEAKGLIDKNL